MCQQDNFEHYYVGEIRDEKMYKKKKDKYSNMPKILPYVQQTSAHLITLVRKDMDINEHERLFNITLRHIFK